MHLKRVNTPALKNKFLEANVRIQKDLSNYIQPLDASIDHLFVPPSKPQQKHDICACWVLLDDHDEPIGRIAGFVMQKYTPLQTPFKVGGFGFFESINDCQASTLLFDTLILWLKEQKVEAVDGPMNFGSHDSWMGLLIKGYDTPPVYGMNFNPPYYVNLFEQYGFKEYYRLLWYYQHDLKNHVLPPKHLLRYQKFEENKDYEIAHLKNLSKKNLDEHITALVEIHKNSFSIYGEARAITKKDIEDIIYPIVSLLDKKLVWFAYHKNVPIGFFINIPDLNQYFKDFNGKLGIWQRLQLIWKKYQNKNTKAVGILFGVDPKYQRLGIHNFMIHKFSVMILQDKKFPYNQIEMGYINDWNIRIKNIYRSLPCTNVHEHGFYRYIFDDRYPFEKHLIVQ
ncbi:MAG: hypothetical protein QM528_00845 [Phycisphaerales bacterium]|nr:hypothetical protein [Phycisphaerales bacterium]